MNSRLALVRATHLNSYISVLHEMGAPVDRELARSRLPNQIEQTPNLYVSIPVAMEWIARTGCDLEPMELGFLGAQKSSLSSLQPAHQAMVGTAQTGLTRLKALAALSRFEDTVLEMTLKHEADNVRVICTMAGLDRHPYFCLAEWLNLQAIISVVRSIAGPFWNPSEICFVSSYCLPEIVQAAFPNTRILMSQPCTSIIVERWHLAQTTSVGSATKPDRFPTSASESDPQAPPEVWEFVSLLRKLIQPYLNEGRPDIAFAAGIAGISTRTLQRRLKVCGSSYSQILQEARFELAFAGLNDPGLKVIDVAMMTGYESPQHFTRAFRRFTGATPSEFRHRRLGDTAMDGVADPRTATG